MNNNYVPAQVQGEDVSNSQKIKKLDIFDNNGVPTVQLKGHNIAVPTKDEYIQANILNNLNANLQNQINNNGFNDTQIDRLNSEESFLKQTILAAIISFNKSNQMRNLVNNARGPKFRELFIKRALLDLYIDPEINKSGIASGAYRMAKTNFYRFTPKMLRDPVYGAVFTKKRGGKLEKGKKTRKNKH
jgi:hypothetical protein